MVKYPINHECYRNTGIKSDLNSYVKVHQALNDIVSLFGDVQFRHIDYAIDGNDDDLTQLDQHHRYNFFNPKAGIFIQPSDNQHAYFSFARASREPNRDNFVDADETGPFPRHETLNDFELGYHYQSVWFTGGVNLFYMGYDHQLVLTGKINDTGAPVMVNVDKSHRKGVEVNWGLKLLPSVKWDANATLSSSTIADFSDDVAAWENGGQQSFHLGKTDLSFSPKLTANSQIRWQPSKRSGVSLISSYVGKQYIDNTSSGDRSLDAWFVNGLTADYTIKPDFFREIRIRVQVNNLFNAEYESNAWVYSYITGGERNKMDGYFPQAGRHFLVGADFRF